MNPVRVSAGKSGGRSDGALRTAKDAERKMRKIRQVRTVIFLLCNCRISKLPNGFESKFLKIFTAISSSRVPTIKLWFLLSETYRGALNGWKMGRIVPILSVRWLLVTDSNTQDRA